MKTWITRVISAVAVVAVTMPAVAQDAPRAVQAELSTIGGEREMTNDGAFEAANHHEAFTLRAAATGTRRRAVQPPPALINAAATQAAKAAMAASVPGVQIAVVKSGRIIYSASFGVYDRENGIALTSRSVMQIGSVTKQFTAAAILRLAERGALSLDDRIEKYVPEFDVRGRTITLRHLLTHTSGLTPDWTFNNVDFRKPATRAQVIAALNAQTFVFFPGKSWKYSNAGYMLLGYAIESITGKPYADFIHSEFALPLGLLDTGVCGTNNLPVPEGYGLTHDVTKPIKRMPPFHATAVLSDGSLCSTASDLARWAHLLATGKAVLPASFEAMTTPGRLDNSALLPRSYALGVFTEMVLGQRAVSHGGAIDGFWTFLLYLRDQDIAVAVITNALPAPSPGSAQLIALAVAEAALKTP